MKNNIYKKTHILFSPTNENPFLAIWKEKNLPSCALSKDNTNSATNFALKHFPELSKIKCKNENDFGLIHRLDNRASGILLFALSQDSYDALLQFQKDEKIIKTYSAVCYNLEENANLLKGYPPFMNMRELLLLQKSITAKSFFRSYEKGSRAVRPVTNEQSQIILKKSGKVLYKTNILLETTMQKNKVQNDENLFFQVKCKIANGFRHQVRCHLSWLGFPIIGDDLYNAHYNSEALCFECVEINFPHPVTKCPVTIKVPRSE